ncbi:hypothetical protein AHAS_Ahas03G0281400 [Arachis hypogaea]
MLKKLVESQLVCSSERKVESYKEKLLEMKTAKIFNFFDMLKMLLQMISFCFC